MDTTVHKKAEEVNVLDDEIYLKRHSLNVRSLVIKIGRQMKLSENELNNLSISGLYHDIGKYGIPGDILHKKGPLNEQEWLIIKQHPYLGAQYLKLKEYNKDIIDAVLYHHEKYDGSGYLHNLKGEQIPVFSRIISVADSFDAMTTDRVYQKKRSIYDAYREIVDMSGAHFDPYIVKMFIQSIDK